MNIALKIIRKFNYFSHYHYGFISPSVPVSNDELCDVGDDKIEEYEKLFAKGIGNGVCLAFGAGRMAFYAILKSLNIGNDDEVVLTGFTCSVMANAVCRTGATVRYCDIDRETLGMAPESLERVISNKTKLVVAQHSFGIPCRIDVIKSICDKHNIFLVEDCALSYMSKYKGRYVGDYGDASIFSTDHTKPINTLIGGMVYTKDKNLAFKLNSIRSAAENYSDEQIENIIEMYKKEHRLLKHNNFNLYVLYIMMSIVKAKVFHLHKSVFLTGDTTPSSEKTHYPYPAKLPKQLAQIGIKVLRYYEEELNERRSILDDFIKRTDKSSLPKMYFSQDAEIIPLRLIQYVTHDEKVIKKRVEGIWFEKPIINTNCKLGDFYYHQGDCVVSEEIGGIIINIPIMLDEKDREKMYKRISI